MPGMARPQHDSSDERARQNDAFMLLNLNKASEMTRDIELQARLLAGVDTRSQGIAGRIGAPSVEGDPDEAGATGSFLPTISACAGECDGAIVAYFGDPEWAARARGSSSDRGRSRNNCSGLPRDGALDGPIAAKVDVPGIDGFGWLPRRCLTQ
jgi:hypothetical protein